MKKTLACIILIAVGLIPMMVLAGEAETGEDAT